MRTKAGRRAGWTAVLTTALSVLLVLPAQAAGGDADVSYHGQVALTEDRLGVWLVPQNSGPSAVPNTTVRLRFTTDLADRQRLEPGCARVGPRVLVCETGPLPAHGSGRHIGLALRLKAKPSETVVRIDTWWNGGATDRDLRNNEHAVLALNTGDPYAF
ncbi:hypothetical protein [Streptomyces sp. NPDC006879]|uniref:hypothetical protein n=1 Tax=Streptomyces sp. NPDC006879 TaxID=3364767 RepID=UPI003679F8B2